MSGKNIQDIFAQQRKEQKRQERADWWRNNGLTLIGVIAALIAAVMSILNFIFK